MDTQDWVNIVLSIGGTIGTALLGLLMSKLNKLEDENESNKDSMNALKLLIANDYVKQATFQSELQHISKKLDKLEDLELQMSTQYARKEDLKTLGENLGRKLDMILDKLERKADKAEWRAGG